MANMISASPSAPCSDTDVTYCIETCCVADGVPVPHACVTCSFLCWRDVESRATCDRFCHFAFQSEDQNSDSNESDGHSNLEVVVYVLGVLVVAFAATTAIVMVRWFRHSSKRKRKARGERRDCVCKNKFHGLTGVTASSTIVGLLPANGDAEGKTTDADSPKTDTSPLNAPPFTGHHRLDMDAGSVCETLTDDEFHDVWTPGTSPASVTHGKTHLHD